MTTNMVESMISILKGVRILPICALVKKTFERTKSWFLNEGPRHNTCYELTINILEILLSYYGKMNNSLSCFMSKGIIEKIKSLMFRNLSLPNFDVDLCHTQSN